VIPVASVQPYINIMRPYNMPALWLSFGVGVVLVGNVSVLDIIGGLLVLTLLHSAANIQNDLADVAVDRANKRQSGLLDGTISPGAVRSLMLGLLGAAFIVALVPVGRLVHVGAAIAVALLSWLYNSSRIYASRRPIASIVILGLCFSAIPLLYGYLLGMTGLRPWVLILAGCWFLQRVSISIMKDYKDASGDRQHTKRTFYLQFGRRATVATGIVLGGLGYAGAIIVFITRGYGIALAYLITLGLMINSMVYRAKQIGVKDEKQLSSLFNKSFTSHTLVEAGLLVCLLL
jgi:4-hydroxybenzoate polyprenyltransferase